MYNIRKNIFLLISLSFVIRLISIYFFHDTRVDNEWGILLNNLIKFKTYSIYTFENSPIPSVLMPPLYAYFLYFVKIISLEKINFLILLISIQIILSTVSIYIFYKINKKLFSEKINLINSYIFSFFPLNIYAAGQVSSITLQIFLLLLFILFLFLLSEKKTKKNFLIFSLISGFLILIRGEFVLIYAITLLYLFLKNKVKLIHVIIIFTLTFLVASPYLIRNFIIFNQVILVKSLGYNLWKGNNEFATVEGYEDINNTNFKNIKHKIEILKKDIFYEINRDHIFLNEGIKNINENPLNYAVLFIKKTSSFYFFNIKSSYPNYYHLIHFIPAIIIGALSIPGLILGLKKKEFEFKFLIIYLFTTIIIFSLFFILPRYKLTILPVQIMLLGCFVEYIFKKLNKNVV